MPLIEDRSHPKLIRERHNAPRIGHASLIDQYAAFVHGSANDVVDKAFNYLFAKDREFQEYQKSAQSAKVVPSLRVRRA